MYVCGVCVCVCVCVGEGVVILWDANQREIPYFLDYSAPLFSSRPRIDRALCLGFRVILRALE